MKLGEILNGMGAWSQVVGLKLKPVIAYKLLKYVRKVEAEHSILQGQRTNKICELAGVEPGQAASLEAGTPEVLAFSLWLGELLEHESDLEKCSMTVDELLEHIQQDESNTLSISDIGTIEPFMK